MLKWPSILLLAILGAKRDRCPRALRRYLPGSTSETWAYLDRPHPAARRDEEDTVWAEAQEILRGEG
jgi:hypothetical protein